MTHHLSRDDAVSPVIGVMLMLVITIVIAAVITGFATGLVGDSKSTPTVMMDVKYNEFFENSYYSMYGLKLKSVDFIHKGGDEFSLSEVAVTLKEYGGPNYEMSQTYTASSTPCKLVVVGKSGDPKSITVSTGDVIKLDLQDADNFSYFVGTSCSWILSDIRTNNIIAKGEFLIADNA